MYKREKTQREAAKIKRVSNIETQMCTIRENCCKDAYNELYYSKNRGFSLGSSAFGMLRRIALLSVLQLVSLFVFLTGFFPQKKILKGEGEFQFNVELQNSTEPAFKKLVFIVIDALRSDFLYDEKSQNFTSSTRG